MTHELIDRLNEIAGGNNRTAPIGAVEVGGIWMSVQASEFAYSSPRSTLDDFSHYDSVEIALMPVGGGGFYDVNAELKHFPRLNELGGSSDGEVLAYVPIDLACSMYDYLNNRG